MSLAADESHFASAAETFLPAFHAVWSECQSAGTRRIRVSPHLAYRDQAVPGIPANAVLQFEVQLLNVTGPAD